MATPLPTATARPRVAAKWPAGWRESDDFTERDLCSNRLCGQYAHGSEGSGEFDRRACSPECAQEMDPDQCHLCGKDEREPFTPAAFSMLMHCFECEEPTCSACGEDDLDWHDRGVRICKECSR